MNLRPECKKWVSRFGSEVKMGQFTPIFFPIFNQFPGRFLLTLQNIKIWNILFFALDKLSSILTIDMNKNKNEFDLKHKS